MPIDTNFPYVFPSSMPVSMKLGVRQGNSAIAWLNCQQALQTTTPIFSDTEMYVHVDSKTYTGCMQQRFDDPASSCRNQEFYDWIKTRLIQIPDAGWDEQTIWKYYVNWLAEIQLPVIKNSASVEMVYEVWNLDKTSDGLPPPNRLPQQCDGLGEDNALLRRVITLDNNIILFRSESSSYSSVREELRSILGQYYEGIKTINDWKMNTGKWGIRVSYLYSLKMYDNYGKIVTKCYCGRWTECFEGTQA
jgi:hypothetical protein